MTGICHCFVCCSAYKNRTFKQGASWLLANPVFEVHEGLENACKTAYATRYPNLKADEVDKKFETFQDNLYQYRKRQATIHFQVSSHNILKSTCPSFVRFI